MHLLLQLGTLVASGQTLDQILDQSWTQIAISSQAARLFYLDLASTLISGKSVAQDPKMQAEVLRMVGTYASLAGEKPGEAKKPSLSGAAQDAAVDAALRDLANQRNHDKAGVRVRVNNEPMPDGFALFERLKSGNYTAGEVESLIRR